MGQHRPCPYTMSRNVYMHCSCSIPFIPCPLCLKNIENTNELIYDNYDKSFLSYQFLCRKAYAWGVVPREGKSGRDLSGQKTFRL